MDRLFRILLDLLCNQLHLVVRTPFFFSSIRICKQYALFNFCDVSVIFLKLVDEQFIWLKSYAWLSKSTILFLLIHFNRKPLCWFNGLSGVIKQNIVLKKKKKILCGKVWNNAENQFYFGSKFGSVVHRVTCMFMRYDVNLCRCVGVVSREPNQVQWGSDLLLFCKRKRKEKLIFCCPLLVENQFYILARMGKCHPSFYIRLISFLYFIRLKIATKATWLLCKFCR